MQLENELLQSFGPYTYGLDEEISALVALSREFDMEVPTFHNDCMDMGGFNPGGNSACSLDLYAFDRYPLIVPTPLLPHNPWPCSTLSDAIDGTESRVRGFGGAAASSPIFCAELQAGYIFYQPRYPLVGFYCLMRWYAGGSANGAKRRMTTSTSGLGLSSRPRWSCSTPPKAAPP